MISGRDFLVLASDWYGWPTSTVHLFRQLALTNRVFWFNIIERLPQPKLADVKKAGGVLATWARQLGSRKPGPTADAESTVYPMTAFTIPWFRSGIRRFNTASLNRTWRGLVQRHGIHDPIVLTVPPTTADFVRGVSAAAKVYYCIDEWAHYPGLDNVTSTRMEQELIDGVDGFVATSRDLLRKGARCRHSLYLPHGVDVTHFRQAVDNPVPVADLEKIPKPIVGFFGLLDKWVDLKLIATLSQRFPQVSFVLIGRAPFGVEAVRGYSNVHYLGPVPYTQLPQSGRYFDVGIIPFELTELTKAVNPLKLMEYYALGLPVLATRLPDLEHVDGPIHLASTPDEFATQLGHILDRRATLSAEAVEVSRRNTWERRALELSDFLAGLPHRSQVETSR